MVIAFKSLWNIPIMMSYQLKPAAKDFATALQEGLDKATNPEFSEVAIQSCDDYDALNRVFHELGSTILDISAQRAKIGHERDPSINGYMSDAESSGIGGTFQLTLVDCSNEQRRIPVGMITTGPKGFPAKLSFPRRQYANSAEHTVNFDQELRECLMTMVSDPSFGSALSLLMPLDEATKH